MAIYIRPEIGQSGFQRSLSGDVSLVGSERLNVACVDIIVGGTSEETDPGMFERPDVPISENKTNASIIRRHLECNKTTSPVLSAFLNTCGDAVRERDLRAIQPGFVMAYSRNRCSAILL